MEKEIFDIINGDCRELSQSIPDKSIDLIFTDPPYPRKYLPLYEWLSKETSRILKPSGFLLVYVGNYYLDTVMSYMRKDLEYFEIFAAINSGPGPMNWHHRIICKHKSIVAYRPIGGSGLPRTNVTSIFTGTGNDKRYHVWQQDERTARYYIDCFSKPGDIIFDPFVGGGTTPYVCKIINRNFIGYEISEEQTEIAKKRLSESIQLEIDSVTQLNFSY